MLIMQITLIKYANDYFHIDFMNTKMFGDFV